MSRAARSDRPLYARTNTFSRVKNDMASIRRRYFYLENEIPQAFRGTRSAHPWGAEPASCLGLSHSLRRGLRLPCSGLIRMTADGGGLDAAPFCSSLVENSARRRNLHRRLAFSTTVRPRRQPWSPLSRRDRRTVRQERSEHRAPGRYRDKDSTFIAPRQAVALAIDAKSLKQKNVDGGEHALVFRFPRGQPSHPALPRPSIMWA